MIPRGVLDIDWPTMLVAAARSPFAGSDLVEASQAVEQAWDHQRPGMPFLSVRSGLDCVLRARQWPAGSEVLMSAVNIPQMADILREHGLVPVPLDVSRHSLAPNVDQLSARITPRTRLILVAHLFGSRLELRDMARIAFENGLELWEDVAQGFAADGFPGDIHADVSFFSFGLIKANTALGGAYVRFRDPSLSERCRAMQSHWPAQPTSKFQRRICRAMLLRLASVRFVYTLISAAATVASIDLDSRLNRLVRGFRPCDLFTQLRQQPCRAQLDLLRKRLLHPDRQVSSFKFELAETCRQTLDQSVLIGTNAHFPSHWVFPICSREPDALRQRLWSQGFDATVRGSQLSVLPPCSSYPQWTAPEAARWMPQLVYLPLHPALRPSHIHTIAETVRQLEV